MNVLIIAAHPDDEVLGAGGAIARHAEAGDTVHIRILGEGATSRHARRNESPGHSVRALKVAAEKAAETLGASSVRVLGFPDNRFDSVDLLDITKALEKEIEETRPSIVYTHSTADLNVDHRTTATAVLTSTRPIPDGVVDLVLSFEIASSTEWSFGQLGSAFTANHFVELSDSQFEAKRRALECYGQEMRAFPHRRSYEVLDAMTRLAGATVGLSRAEAFELVRSRNRLP